MFPELISHGIEYNFALWRESPEDKNGLLTDGIDRVADLIVMKQEIDELSDLNVIYADLRFVVRR